LIGARTQAELNEAEFDLVHANTIILRENPPEHTMGLSEWQAIHKALFGDIYEWAGELRTVDIAKATAGYGFRFVESAFFATAVSYTESEIRESFAETPRSRDEFVAALAEQYSTLNVLHPFREGNDRMQRFFWNRVAESSGYRLDWLQVTAEQNGIASAVGAVKADYSRLRVMLDMMLAAGSNANYASNKVGAEAARLSTACLRCGSALTSPESVARGMGKRCSQLAGAA